MGRVGWQLSQLFSSKQGHTETEEGGDLGAILGGPCQAALEPAVVLCSALLFGCWCAQGGSQSQARRWKSS